MIKDIHIDVLGQSEDALQQKCVFWFNRKYPLLRGLLFAVPNGGYRNKREAYKFLQTGLVKGVSDLILLFNGRAYLLEAKTLTGKQSKTQKLWEEKVSKNGFDYYVFRSLRDFKQIIDLIIAENSIINGLESFTPPN